MEGSKGSHVGKLYSQLVLKGRALLSNPYRCAADPDRPGEGGRGALRGLESAAGGWAALAGVREQLVWERDQRQSQENFRGSRYSRQGGASLLKTGGRRSPAIRWKLQNLTRLKAHRPEQFERQHIGLAARLGK